LTGRSSIPEAAVADRYAAAYWIAWSSRAMTWECEAAVFRNGGPCEIFLAMHPHPSFDIHVALMRGRREGRVQAAPMARLRKKCRRQVPQDWPNNRPSLRDSLRLIRALLGAPGFLATVIGAML
jgi:hypothetical protein